MGALVLGGNFQDILPQYPPGRILIDEAMALLPRLVARAVCFCAAIGSLFITRRIWRILAEKMAPAPAGVEFCAAALALLLFGRWFVRDLDECGLHLVAVLSVDDSVVALLR